MVAIAVAVCFGEVDTGLLFTSVITIMPIAIATIVEHIGGISAIASTTGINYIKDPVTHEPHDYYCKLPDPISLRTIIVLDPMLATGGSACAAVDFIKKRAERRLNLWQ